MPLRSVEYSSRIINLSRFVYCISLEKLRKKFRLMLMRGAEGLMIRSICTDGQVPLRSVEYSLPIVYLLIACHQETDMLLRGQKA